MLHAIKFYWSVYNVTLIQLQDFVFVCTYSSTMHSHLLIVCTDWFQARAHCSLPEGSSLESLQCEGRGFTCTVCPVLGSEQKLSWRHPTTDRTGIDQYHFHIPSWIQHIQCKSENIIKFGWDSESPTRVIWYVGRQHCEFGVAYQNGQTTYQTTFLKYPFVWLPNPLALYGTLRLGYSLISTLVWCTSCSRHHGTDP